MSYKFAPILQGNHENVFTKTNGKECQIALVHVFVSRFMVIDNGNNIENPGSNDVDKKQSQDFINTSL